MLTIEKAVKMQGTEFTYRYSDGDPIPAYVKKFDPETGKLACYSLEDKTRDGYTPKPNKDTLPDGTFCVYASDNLSRSLETLSEILETGEVKAPRVTRGRFRGCQF